MSVPAPLKPQSGLETTRTCAIVLAAGRSRRMGARKLLLPFAGSTVIARVADAFLGAPVAATLVVVGPADQEMSAALAGRAVRLVENPDPEGEMLGSVRCGLRALPPSTETVLVSPGDQPSLESALVRRMLEAYREAGQAILVPVYARRRGHPLIFAARFREEILTALDGAGLRGLLQAHAAEVNEWPTDDAAVVEDLDTPADYHRAEARLGERLLGKPTV